MIDKVCNAMFVCTGNPARSLLVEGLLNHFARGRFGAHSAGSHPSGAVNPFALSTLQTLRIPTEGFQREIADIGNS